MTRGTKDTLVVESDPAGADVRLSTGGAGKTPTSFKLSRKKELDVFIEKEGYEPLAVHVSSQVSGSGAVGMAGNVLIGGLIGAGVDVATGATKDLRPNPIKVVMVRKKEVTPTQAVASAGAPPPTQPTAPTSPAAVVNGGAAGGPGEILPVVPFKPSGKQVGTLRPLKKLEAGPFQDAVAAAFRGREWEVTEKGSDHVVGHIEQGRKEAVLAVVYDGDLIQMYGEGWKIDKATGARLKPSLPDSWIENIRSDLAERLGLTPPES